MFNLPPFPVGDMLMVAGNFVYMLWFVLVVSALTARRARLAGAVAVWIFLLIVFVFISVYVPATPGFSFPLRLIPEPLNTYLFFATGVVLIVFLIIRKNQRVTA